MFGFRLESIFAAAQVASKNNTCFKNWSKVTQK